MHTPTRCLAALLMSTVCLGAAALDAKVEPYGNVGVPKLSGSAGYVFPLDLEVASTLYSISLSEKGDRPCAVQARYRYETISDGEPRELQANSDTAWIDACDRSVSQGTGPVRAGANSRKSATIADAVQPLRTGARRAAVGVSVCLNAAETRVKGIQIHGANVLADGQISADEALDDEFMRANCKAPFKPASMCGNRRVVSGLDLQFRYPDGHPANVLVGIGVRCQRMRSVPFRAPTATMQNGSIRQVIRSN